MVPTGRIDNDRTKVRPVDLNDVGAILRQF
jgi:hypothetical protein